MILGKMSSFVLCLPATPPLSAHPDIGRSLFSSSTHQAAKLSSSDLMRIAEESQLELYRNRQMDKDRTAYALPKKLRIRFSTCAYIASVTRPVCVFCWLGW